MDETNNLLKIKKYQFIYQIKDAQNAEKMNLVNIFEKIILWSKMFLSMRSSKYNLIVNYSLKKYLRLFITPPNSFIQWVYLIWWVISKMMMKNLDDQSWNHHNKNKINSKHTKWWKTIHFMDVKKVYFLKIMLDE